MDLLRVLLGVILLSLLFARPVAGWTSHPEIYVIAAMGGHA